MESSALGNKLQIVNFAITIDNTLSMKITDAYMPK